MKQIRRVAIIGGSRIPFARSNSAYIGKSNQDMLTAALRGIVDKFQLHGEPWVMWLPVRWSNTPVTST